MDLFCFGLFLVMYFPLFEANPIGLENMINPLVAQLVERV